MNPARRRSDFSRVAPGREVSRISIANSLPILRPTATSSWLSPSKSENAGTEPGIHPECPDAIACASKKGWFKKRSDSWPGRCGRVMAPPHPRRQNAKAAAQITLRLLQNQGFIRSPQTALTFSQIELTDNIPCRDRIYGTVRLPDPKGAEMVREPPNLYLSEILEKDGTVRSASHFVAMYCLASLQATTSPSHPIRGLRLDFWQCCRSIRNLGSVIRHAGGY